MSEISLILVLLFKTNKTLNDMAKIQIKSEKLTPFGGIFSIMEQFDALLAQTIDSTLGLRCTLFGYQYSEILRSLMCVYLCGGSCIEDVTTHLMKHLSLHPTLRTCSADTILRAIGELTCKNITYKSASGKSYDFNTADKMNCLLIKALLATGQLKSGQEFSHSQVVLLSDFRVLGNVILRRLVQESNTLLPIISTPSGMSIF